MADDCEYCGQRLDGLNDSGHCLNCRGIDEKVSANYTKLQEQIQQLRAEIKELKNDNLNLSDDLGWHKAIFDGSWPQAVEILENTLAKVKAQKGE